MPTTKYSQNLFERILQQEMKIEKSLTFLSQVFRSLLFFIFEKYFLQFVEYYELLRGMMALPSNNAWKFGIRIIEKFSKI